MVTKRNGENRDRNGHVLVWEQPGIQDENTDCYVERRKGENRKVMLFTNWKSTCLSYFALGVYESVLR